LTYKVLASEDRDCWLKFKWGLEVDDDVVVIARTESELDDVVSFTCSDTTVQSISSIDIWRVESTNLHFKVTVVRGVENRLSRSSLMEVLAIQGLAVLS